MKLVCVLRRAAVLENEFLVGLSCEFAVYQPKKISLREAALCSHGFQECIPECLLSRTMAGICADPRGLTISGVVDEPVVVAIVGPESFAG